MHDFSYIIAQISDAPMQESPFRHIEIDTLFHPDDFDAIISTPEIALSPAPSDKALIDALFATGYRVVDFPGAITNIDDYLSWHGSGVIDQRTGLTCEGFGVVLRQEGPRSEIVRDLKEFVASPPFIDAIARKFNIDSENCKYDSGIQKYLDGYEISPHPDIRKKALTFMININPNPASHEADHHTRYLRFLPEWDYVRHYWEGNPAADRCWVPWDWCEEQKQQSQNNSMVIFAPNNDTLHAVRAHYNHLAYQRTQVYGNLWFKDIQINTKPTWQDLMVRSADPSRPKQRLPLLRRMGFMNRSPKKTDTRSSPYVSGSRRKL